MLCRRRAFYALLRVEWLSYCRSPSRWFAPWWFFAVVEMLFPLALTPSADALRQLAPGAIWIGMVLALLLSLEHLFAEDRASGWMAQQRFWWGDFWFWVGAKLLLHWVFSLLPLVFAAGFVGMLFGLSAPVLWKLMLGLGLGSLVLCFLGGVITALSLGVQGQQTGLLALLLLPLAIPVILFGIGSASPLGGVMALFLLVGLSCFVLVLLPWLIAVILSW